MKRVETDDVLRSLIYQVGSAMPKGGTEQDVTTIITRPMWRVWCRSAGIPEDSEPTEWIGTASHRVFGSKTIVVDRPYAASVSFATPPTKESFTL